MPLIPRDVSPRPTSDGMDGFGPPRQEVGEQLELSEALAGWEPKYPDLQVIHQVVPQSPAQALVEASAQASLMVVGAHHRRGHLGMALGRVNHAVLRHAVLPGGGDPRAMRSLGP